jgi:hypothetical protein
MRIRWEKVGVFGLIKGSESILNEGREPGFLVKIRQRRLGAG